MTKRISLWDKLSALGHLKDPWIVFGDFNAMFSYGDRSGGRQWLDVFPKIVVMNKWDAISDHSYCIIKHVEAGNLGTIPFRFCNYWMNREGYKEAVLCCWNNQTSSKGLKGIVQKLLRTKHVLKRFHRDNQGDIIGTYKAAKEEFNTAKGNVAANPSNQSLQVVEKSTQQVYISAKKDYTSYMQQHAKLNWMKFGDENSSFFHASLKKRRQENRILSYCSNEEVIEDYPKVIEHFLNHFKNFMGKGSSATRRLDQTILARGKILDI
ncbi:uncharacterized protein LOC115719862 [Cannabis sativa]|uniref:uncharacterized protein LOC115719862 n=1 Tax=Cannabis sativa TaxID=3483 RepID=UPI0011DF82D1|nr:uncharacterized protein LOC115719862 [Cannabis sativa]